MTVAVRLTHTCCMPHSYTWHNCEKNANIHDSSVCAFILNAWWCLRRNDSLTRAVCLIYTWGASFTRQVSAVWNIDTYLMHYTYIQMTRLCLMDEGFVCVACLIRVCSVTHWCRRHDSLMQEACFVDACDVHHWYMQHNSWMCGGWLSNIHI